MKLIMTSIAAGSLLAALAMAQPSRTPRYAVHDLGPVGNPPGQLFFMTNNGLIAGAAAISNSTMHAALWYKGVKIDIGTPGLNSAAFGVNERGQAVGQAETSTPNGEDFCGFNFYGFPPLGTTCLPFVWQNGVMTKLPTLGGPNGVANMINSRGDVVGFAENNTQDPGCTVFQFKPVVWINGQIHELATNGDRNGAAIAINDNGQAVGVSGPCAAFNGNLGLYLLDAHALLWEKDGSVHDLGNLGGDGGFGGNHACAINNKGQVVGHSDLTNDATFHAYLWPNPATGKMQDLETLQGDFASLALGINERGEVVGASLAADFSARAFLWENGTMFDLNKLIPPDSGWQLQLAKSINSRGEIVGTGTTSTGEVHGFLAIPQ
jgi:probable HAF family extracellular repeat protein